MPERKNDPKGADLPTDLKSAIDWRRRQLRTNRETDGRALTEWERAQIIELAEMVRDRLKLASTIVIFTGPSGTGKRLAAEIIATSLQKDLYSIDLAAVVNEYIGETEKNLERVFLAAEEADVILLLDEADALFGSFRETQDTNGRCRGMEIGRLLRRVENRPALSIVMSDLSSEELDPAFLRRLHFIVQFPLPKPQDRRQIWERIFPE